MHIELTHFEMLLPILRRVEAILAEKGISATSYELVENGAVLHLADCSNGRIVWSIGSVLDEKTVNECMATDWKGPPSTSLLVEFYDCDDTYLLVLSYAPGDEMWKCDDQLSQEEFRKLFSQARNRQNLAHLLEPYWERTSIDPDAAMNLIGAMAQVVSTPSIPRA